MQDLNNNVEATVKQEKYALTITSDSVTSTDTRFTIDNLSLGDNYRPLDVYFIKSTGEKVRRDYTKGERRIANQTMPKLVCQIFEKQLSSLSIEEREAFPICKYKPNRDVIHGIYTSIDEFNKQYKTIQNAIYSYDSGRQFVFYCWNVFSTITFVQECLKRFGNSNDKMVLIYREKDKQESVEEPSNDINQKESTQESMGYQNPYSSILLESKNLILRGAPGTGKSYLAKEIAADIISNGYYDKLDQLSTEQRKQVEFVQFHPSYDYSDFVEGLRPKLNEDGSMGFELHDGIFTQFIKRARKNFEDSRKSADLLARESSAQEALQDFLSNIEFGVDTYKTINGKQFTIINADENHIYISIPSNSQVKKLNVNTEQLLRMLEADTDFTQVKDITAFFGKTFARHEYSYEFVLYQNIKHRKATNKKVVDNPTQLKKYVFIIDEINRGEISKIFGELFYAIDPGYRGKSGEITTQYANLHINPDDKFYIPENVYIIGTMNDIDRSVDSFDYAMRRRFRFIELKANDHLEMLADIEDEVLRAEAIRRMYALNEEIAAVEDLNESYQIGASYFLKLKTLSFDQLWTDYLCPLLQEYIHGMYDEAGIMNRFAKVYGYKIASSEADDELPAN